MENRENISLSLEPTLMAALEQRKFQLSVIFWNGSTCALKDLLLPKKLKFHELPASSYPGPSPFYFANIL